MGRKIPDGLHSALYELLDILSKYSSQDHDVSEEDFQKLFEEYNYIWAVLGYSTLLPQPKCDLIVEQCIEGDYIEPDFIAYNEIRERWEIVDLKLPKRTIQLNNRDRRKRFKSEIEDYVSQVEDYSDYFNESRHREHVKSEHDIEIPPSPPTVLVLGSYINQKEINNILDRYSHDISITQYDKILSLLKKEFVEKSGEEGGMPGITVASRMTLMSKPNNSREYIFDIGKSTDSERLSLYMTPDNQLTLEIISKTGLEFDVSVSQDEVLDIKEQKTVCIEFASTEELSFARLSVGSKIHDEMILTMEVPFADIEIGSGFEGVDDKFDLYLGADQNGENGAMFAKHQLVIYSKTHDIDERLQLLRGLENKWEGQYDGVFFDKDEYLYTDDGSDLINKTESEKPTYVEGKDWTERYPK